MYENNEHLSFGAGSLCPVYGGGGNPQGFK